MLDPVASHLTRLLSPNIKSAQDVARVTFQVLHAIMPHLTPAATEAPTQNPSHPTEPGEPPGAGENIVHPQTQRHATEASDVPMQVPLILKRPTITQEALQRHLPPQGQPLPRQQAAVEAPTQRGAQLQLEQISLHRLAAAATTSFPQESTPRLADAPPPSTVPRGPSYPAAEGMPAARPQAFASLGIPEALAIPARSSIPPGANSSFRPSPDRQRRLLDQRHTHAPYSQTDVSPYGVVESLRNIRNPEPIEVDQGAPTYEDKKGDYREVAIEEINLKKLFTDIDWGKRPVGIAYVGSSDISPATTSGSGVTTPSTGQAKIYSFDIPSQTLQQDSPPGDTDTLYNNTDNVVPANTWVPIHMVGTVWFVALPSAGTRYAKTGGGIAARSGTTLGQTAGLTLCQNVNGILTDIPGTVTIYNHSGTAVPASKYCLVTRVDGKWSVFSPEC